MTEGIKKHTFDAIVIGGGAAGMAAAEGIARAGHSVAIVEREEYLGGILNQCIHNGFGLHRFKEILTGPEYAENYIEALSDTSVSLFLQTTAVRLTKDTKRIHILCYSALHGVVEFETTALVLAMGCRERNRGNIAIGGTRPAGVFTAGLAQRLLNIDGYKPGKNVVIIGSGDIGLIMARRMTWVGCTVRAVVEILPYPSGLTRNIVQCLEDFSIPLYLSHAVTTIHGKQRVRGVTIAPLTKGIPDSSQSFDVPCDTLLLSVGLIPENELSRTAGVTLSPDTNGPIVDSSYQTNVAGIFACGNVLHVHDLVDWVSEESARCASHVSAYIRGKKSKDTIKAEIQPGPNLKYVLPQQCTTGQENTFMMRALCVLDKAKLIVSQNDTVIATKTIRHIKPAEMISMKLFPGDLSRITADMPVTFSLQAV